VLTFLNATGVSLATQFLHLLVFVTRYLDFLVFGFSVNAYVDSMKAYLLVCSSITTFIIARRLRKEAWGTSPRRHVMRQVMWLASACLVPAIVFNYALTAAEVAWAFSIYLSAVADVPQLRMLVNADSKDGLLLVYEALVFAHRGLYLPHWYLRLVIHVTRTESPLLKLALNNLPGIWIRHTLTPLHLLEG
jgi:ER lumen protein retaining receptor